MKLNPEVMLSIAECATYLHKSERAIYKWVTKGTVRHTRDSSGKTIIRLGDLLEAETSTKRGRPAGIPTRR